MRLITMIVLFTSLLFTACVLPGTRPDHGSSQPGGSEILIGKDKVPPDIAQWAEHLKPKTESASTRAFGNWDGYIVSMGEKPTAGYSVEIENASFDAGKQWIIDVVFKSPAPGDIVAQVITNPYQVFAVPRGTPVKVRKLAPGGSVTEIKIRQ